MSSGDVTILQSAGGDLVGVGLDFIYSIFDTGLDIVEANLGAIAAIVFVVLLWYGVKRYWRIGL